MGRVIVTAIAALALFASCGEQKKTDGIIIAQNYEIPKPTAPKSLTPASKRQQVEWNGGRTYYVDITGMSVDSLPMVSNEYGQKYKDNTIRLEVSRSDSTVFFKRTFRKADFGRFLKSDYRDKAILAGMNFLGADESKLLFLAWVNYPEAGDDEAIEVRVAVDMQGNVSMQPFSYDDREDVKESQ